MLGKENHMKDILLTGKHILKTCFQRDKRMDILSDISVDIYHGDFTIIMGPSGAGKSTLLYALSGMDSISEGSVEYKGNVLHQLSEKEIARIRAKEFGFVFQQCHLVSHLTLYENVLVAGYLGDKEEIHTAPNRAEKLMREMRVWEAKDQLPSQASGGEQQRAAIARAVMNRPSLLFSDEPSGALNKSNTEEVLNLLSRLNTDGQSILMVTHDVRAAIRGNRILYLEDGKIIDEMELDSYDRTEAKGREEAVSQWLSSLQW